MKPFSISNTISMKACIQFAFSSHICRYFQRSQLFKVTANTWISFDGSVRTVDCRLECTCLWCWDVLITPTNRRRSEIYLTSEFLRKRQSVCELGITFVLLFTFTLEATQSSTTADPNRPLDDLSCCRQQVFSDKWHSFIIVCLLRARSQVTAFTDHKTWKIFLFSTCQDLSITF